MITRFWQYENKEEAQIRREMRAEAILNVPINQYIIHLEEASKAMLIEGLPLDAKKNAAASFGDWCDRLMQVVEAHDRLVKARRIELENKEPLAKAEQDELRQIGITEKRLARERDALPREFTLMEQVLATGKPPVGANTDTDFRKLAWSLALDFALLNKQIKKAEAAAAEEKFSWPPVRDIEAALANTHGMQVMKAKFVERTETDGRALGARRTQVQFGKRGSWFFQSRQQDESGLTRTSVNMELHKCLRLGDKVDALFQHEMQHQEHSDPLPERVLRPQREMAKAMDQLKGFGSIHIDTKANDIPEAQQDAIRNYLMKSTEFSQLHRFWNAVEDNMCDQGALDMSWNKAQYGTVEAYQAAHPEDSDRMRKKTQPYPFRLDKNINEIGTLLLVGKDISNRTHFKSLAERDNDTAQAILLHRGWAAAVSRFMHNGLVDHSPEGWKQLGIDSTALENASHPEWSAEQTAEDLYQRMREIATCQPHPDARMFPKIYARQAKEYNAKRNALIESVIADYAEAPLQAMLDEIRDRPFEELFEEMKQHARQAAQAGGMGIPGTGGGSGSQSIFEGIEQPEADADRDFDPDEYNMMPLDDPDPDVNKVDTPEQWRKLREEAFKNTNQDVDEAPQPKAAKGKPAPMTKPGGKPGKGAYDREAIAQIPFGDGMTLAELRALPAYQHGVETVAECLRDIQRNFPNVNIEMGRRGMLAEPDSHFPDPAESFDENRLMDAVEAYAAREDFRPHIDRLYKPTITHRIEAPGSLTLGIDCSGSMGGGTGSPLLVAMQSAMLLYDAGQQAGIDVTIMLWDANYPTYVTSAESSPEKAASKMDGILRNVKNQESIGMGGGTIMDASIASFFACHTEPPSDQRFDDKLRGPAFGMTITDSEVGKSAGRGMGNALREAPGMSMDLLSMNSEAQADAVLTFNEELAHAPGLKEYQRPVIKAVTRTEKIPEQLIDWAREKQLQVSSALQQNSQWDLTDRSLREQSMGALQRFCEKSHDNQRAAGKRGNDAANDHVKHAQEQLRGLFDDEAARERISRRLRQQHASGAGRGGGYAMNA